MVSPRIVAAAASLCTAVVVALYVRGRLESAPELEGHRAELRGTSLAYTVPTGWDDSDHSSCSQPCVRLRLLPQARERFGDLSITLQRVPDAATQSTPMDYA